MEVLVGPNFGIDVSSSSAYVRDLAQDNHAAVASCLGVGSDSRICAPEKAPVDDALSDSSSSIGVPDASDDEEEEDDTPSNGGADEAQSKFRGRSFGSLASLEESLPIKRGLSNHFSGKSKSFANLSDISTIKDLEKRDNPLNKRRKILIASKWSKKSFYTWANPKSIPLLTLNEDEENQAEQEEHEKSQEEEEEGEENNDVDGDGDSDGELCRLGLAKFHDKTLTGFKTRSCFSLADLQEHALIDQEEDHQN